VLQFDERQRLLSQEELVTAKRKIQELESLVHVPPSKKPTLHLARRDQPLSAFGFTSSGSAVPAKNQPLLCCTVAGCDRQFATPRQRANHVRAHQFVPALEKNFKRFNVLD